MSYAVPINIADDINIIIKHTGGGVAIIPIAADGIVGGIKPLYTSVYGARINRSGLVIQGDGTTYINTNANRGVTRDGAGQVQINPASQAEVTAGTEAYKPVTPATLAGELERRSVYSTTPQRVGIWIDGETPIWRVVIPMTSLEALDLYSPRVTTQFDITTILTELDIITDARRVIYINDRIIFTQGQIYDCGDYGDNVTNPAPGVYVLAATEYEGDTEAQYVYGWIEFATLEDNLE